MLGTKAPVHDELDVADLPVDGDAGDDVTTFGPEPFDGGRADEVVGIGDEDPDPAGGHDGLQPCRSRSRVASIIASRVIDPSGS